MKRITRLNLRNFKAFRDQEFEFDGKNVLIYGNNGSGKSSLYWALYTILQSASQSKSEADVRRYFQPFDSSDPDTFRSLKNIFAAASEEAHIKLTWRDGETGPETIQTISNTVVNTKANTVLTEANMASDFITHKLLQNFYNASHNQETNLWDVFMRDIFPYFSEDGPDFKTQLESFSLPKRFTEKAKERLNEVLIDLNGSIERFIGQIETNANELLKLHFFNGQNKLEIKLSYNQQLDIEWVISNAANQRNNKPVPTRGIKLWVRIYDAAQSQWIENHRPHSFLNEAQLTRIAFAVRIGALRTRPQTSDFKILCLDDMLISLDMSNRMQLVKLILNQENKASLRYFEQYQRIILTHSKGFFNAVKRYTSTQEWKYYELTNTETFTQPDVEPSLSPLEQAIRAFEAHEMETCGLLLRQEIEDIAKTYLKLDELEEENTHQALGALLSKMRDTACQHERLQFDRLFLEKDSFLTIDQLRLIETDFATNTELDATVKGKLTSVQRSLNGYLVRQYTIKETATQLMEKTRFVVDFYLNQHAHSTTLPTHEDEVTEALDVVKRLRKFLDDKQ